MLIIITNKTQSTIKVSLPPATAKDRDNKPISIGKGQTKQWHRDKAVIAHFDFPSAPSSQKFVENGTYYVFGYEVNAIHKIC